MILMGRGNRFALSGFFESHWKVAKRECRLRAQKVNGNRLKLSIEMLAWKERIIFLFHKKNIRSRTYIILLIYDYTKRLTLCVIYSRDVRLRKRVGLNLFFQPFTFVPPIFPFRLIRYPFTKRSNFRRLNL